MSTYQPAMARWLTLAVITALATTTIVALFPARAKARQSPSPSSRSTPAPRSATDPLHGIGGVFISTWDRRHQNGLAQ